MTATAVIPEISAVFTKFAIAVSFCSSFSNITTFDVRKFERNEKHAIHDENENDFKKISFCFDCCLLESLAIDF